MSSRKKWTEETFVKYYYEKLALLNLCRITGSDAISCIIGGISKVHIVTAANAGNYATPEALFSYLSAVSDHNQPSHSKHLRHEKVWKRREHRHDQGKPKPKKLPAQEPSSNFAKKCFICGKSSHVKQQCPVKDTCRCNLCDRTGHHEDRCFKKKTPNPIAWLYETGLGCNKQDKYFKEVTINNKKTKAFVDFDYEYVVDLVE